MLSDGANCEMIENEDFDNYSENVCVDGGIWDMNHNNQWPNPYHFPDENGKYWFDKMGVEFRDWKIFRSAKTLIRGVYSGMCMRFCRIRHFVLKNITFKNPVVYGAQLACVEDFSVQDIVFDYTEGSPKLWNMDGVHIEGNSKNGWISNLKGACHDDIVAITADDALYGPIENIYVDGIYAEGAHSAVRILSHGEPIKNVSIRNVFGSYYTYSIGITKYHGGDDERGKIENVTIENLFASLSEGTADVKGGKRPIVWVQKGLDVDGLCISGARRVEKCFPNPFLIIEENTKVKNLRLRDISQRSELGVPIPLIQLDGEVELNLEENLTNT
jgi:polygalacturonase